MLLHGPSIARLGAATVEAVRAVRLPGRAAARAHTSLAVGSADSRVDDQDGQREAGAHRDEYAHDHQQSEQGSRRFVLLRGRGSRSRAPEGSIVSAQPYPARVSD